MARVIVVTSGKGGVGKTSVTSNLGIALSKNNKVCLIDADLGLKNLDVVLGIENRVIFDMQDVISGLCSLSQALVKDKRSNNLSVIRKAVVSTKGGCLFAYCNLKRNEI